MFPIPNDTVLLIINKLDIRDISSFRQVCKEANNIFDWNNYFLSNTTISEAYNKYSIDSKFMKKYGKYLMNITDINIVKQWFTYYSSINNILAKYEIFMNKEDRNTFNIQINYRNQYFLISYNKKFNQLWMTGHRNHNDKNIKNIIHEKLKEILLSTTTIFSIRVSVDEDQIYLDSIF